jgi:hypothetical protein
MIGKEIRDKEKDKKYSKEYYWSHRKQTLAVKKKYYHEHFEQEQKKGKEYNIAHPEIRKKAEVNYRSNHPERVLAHILARGIPLSAICELCGAVAKDRHHPDYSRPLFVMHLCKKCHRETHKAVA